MPAAAATRSTTRSSPRASSAWGSRSSPTPPRGRGSLGARRC
ncbi:hypothetical protein NKG05_15485 [Oerskovia sp. M15]